MRVLYHLIAKELLLLRRDWHALLLLFVMPALFILIMSLALRDTFASHGPSALNYYMVNSDTDPVSADIAAKIKANPSFHEAAAGSEISELTEKVKSGSAHFIVVIPLGFAKALRDKSAMPLLVQAGPSVETALFRLFEAAVREAVSKIYLREMLQSYGAEELDLDQVDKLVNARSLYEGLQQKPPSSVQQNVPAWLVFAMFFIAIPLSTTWVQERALGTMARMKTIGVSTPALLLGKLLPYALINLVQVVLMLGVGVYVVPLFGGESLNLGHAPLALIAMALSLSFAAVSFALLVANLVSSSEQATIFTAVCNLVLAALGGIMVPRFVMPLAMQKISLFSPLAWGLEGFLDVFLRQGTLSTVTSWAGMLFCFGLACLSLAAIRMEKQSAH